MSFNTTLNIPKSILKICIPGSTNSGIKNIGHNILHPIVKPEYTKKKIKWSHLIIYL